MRMENLRETETDYIDFPSLLLKWMTLQRPVFIMSRRR